MPITSLPMSLINREALRLLEHELRVMDCCPTCGRSRLEAVEPHRYELTDSPVILKEVISYPSDDFELSINKFTEKYIQPAMAKIAKQMAEMKATKCAVLEMPTMAHFADRVSERETGLSLLMVAAHDPVTLITHMQLSVGVAA